MDKGYHRSSVRIAWGSRWFGYLESVYIAYMVLQFS